MKTKKNGAKVSNGGHNDLMSMPQVAGVNPSVLAAISKTLLVSDPKPLAAKAKEEDDGSTTTSTTTTTEDVEEDGTTTTTVESEETTTTPGAEDEEDAEEGDDEGDDEEPAAATPAPKPTASTSTGRRTSADVLRLVVELTGFSTPAEQIGALTALRDQAASAEGSRKAARKAERMAAKRELRTMVDGAIKARKLSPDQREWAMSAGLATIKGYLAKAKPLVRDIATNTGKIPAASTPNGAPSTGNAELDATVATVAAACMTDPAAVAAHAVTLKAAGLIH